MNSVEAARAQKKAKENAVARTSEAMGSCFREQLTHWTDPAVFTQPDQWKGLLSAMVTAHEADLLYKEDWRWKISSQTLVNSNLSFRQWSDEFSSWVERIDRGRDFLGKCVALDSSFDHRQCQEP